MAVEHDLQLRPRAVRIALLTSSFLRPARFAVLTSATHQLIELRHVRSLYDLQDHHAGFYSSACSLRLLSVSSRVVSVLSEVSNRSKKSSRSRK
jgi:hypothetical protein